MRNICCNAEEYFMGLVEICKLLQELEKDLLGYT